MNTACCQDLNDTIRSFWELESLGISHAEKRVVSTEEQVAIRQLEENIKYKDGRYEVALLWKYDEQETLTSNKSYAEKRLASLSKKLKMNHVLADMYHKAVMEYIDGNIAEPIENEIEGNNCWFLPHQAVIRQDKTTTKVRIVFDASAKEKGSFSLNDCLDPGPSLLPDLFELLIRFRKHQTAFVADIEKAFLQIAIRKEDQEFLRFLWYKDIGAMQRGEQPIVFRMKRVVFGVNCSPFLLTATIWHHLKRYEETEPETVECLKRDMYVDDWLGGSRNEIEAVKLAQTGKKIIQEAGMTLRKWRSNSARINNSESEESVVLCKADQSNVLGVKWKPEKDALYFDVLQNDVSEPITKRKILSCVSRVYDPLGLVSPVVVRGKLIMQDLWSIGIDWDDHVPKEIESKFLLWMKDVHSLKSFSISRFIGDEEKESLHMFSDASEKAYGAMIYLRTEKPGQKHASVILVTSKTRVAPKKRVTVPRLELMGAMLGARLMEKVKNQIKNKEYLPKYYWTDSRVTLAWIKSSSGQNWKTFVANRVEEILRTTEPSEWLHVPGKLNPADLLSRGGTVRDIDSDYWKHGPNWLASDRSEWPEQNGNGSTADVLPEQKKSKTLNFTIPTCEIAIPISKYSQLNRLLAVTGWIFRFVWNCRQKKEDRRKGTLTALEVEESEIFWLRYEQQCSFREEFDCVSRGEPLPPISRLSEFNPFLDNHAKVIRVGGRLQRSELPDEMKHPILLPSRGVVVDLIIKNAHERLLHASVRDVLVQLRQKYWVLRGRQAIRRIIHQCQICRRKYLTSYHEMVAPLPEIRVTPTFRPFKTVGMDYAGPVYAKMGEKVHKTYILLITCTVTRAIHLELTLSQNLKDFVDAFKRFVARRGCCEVVMSDNAQTFKAASKVLSVEYKVEWRFIVERAPWHGGIWERLVRSVKEPLRKALGRSCLDYVSLWTLLNEIEAVINSRPITYVSDDVNDVEPLTPAHFIIGERLTDLPCPGRATESRPELHQMLI